VVFADGGPSAFAAIKRASGRGHLVGTDQRRIVIYKSWLPKVQVRTRKGAHSLARCAPRILVCH
jgi:hypothetical protein